MTSQSIKTLVPPPVVAPPAARWAADAVVGIVRLSATVSATLFAPSAAAAAAAVSRMSQVSLHPRSKRFVRKLSGA